MIEGKYVSPDLKRDSKWTKVLDNWEVEKIKLACSTPAPAGSGGFFVGDKYHYRNEQGNVYRLEEE